MSVHDDVIFVGCADGGLRLIPVGTDGLLDYNPQVWNSLHGEESPALTSLSILNGSQNNDKDLTSYTCATGAEDGSVSISQLSHSPSK